MALYEFSIFIIIIIIIIIIVIIFCAAVAPGTAATAAARWNWDSALRRTGTQSVSRGPRHSLPYLGVHRAPPNASDSVSMARVTDPSWLRPAEPAWYWDTNARRHATGINVVSVINQSINQNTFL